MKAPDSGNDAVTAPGKGSEAIGAFYAIVRGRVQGVGFRYSAVREAKRAGVYGWVRNAIDGNVEVWAEGRDDDLGLFLKWLRRGPQYSNVVSVRKEEKSPKGYSDFTVEY